MSAPYGGGAVMAHRGPDLTGRDDFPTPPWAGRALCWLAPCRAALERTEDWR